MHSIIFTFWCLCCCWCCYFRCDGGSSSSRSSITYTVSQKNVLSKFWW